MQYDIAFPIGTYVKIKNNINNVYIIEKHFPPGSEYHVLTPGLNPKTNKPSKTHKTKKISNIWRTQLRLVLIFGFPPTFNPNGNLTTYNSNRLESFDILSLCQTRLAIDTVLDLIIQSSTNNK